MLLERYRLSCVSRQPNTSVTGARLCPALKPLVRIAVIAIRDSAHACRPINICHLDPDGLTSTNAVSDEGGPQNAPIEVATPRCLASAWAEDDSQTRHQLRTQ